MSEEPESELNAPATKYDVGVVAAYTTLAIQNLSSAIMAASLNDITEMRESLKKANAQGDELFAIFKTLTGRSDG